MAAKNKTAETNVPVVDFIHAFVDKEQKRNDSFRLIGLMRKWSGYEAAMWGPSIIGFGKYHYKYASGHEGDAPLIAFSPRKAGFSLYVVVPGHEDRELISRLGKYRMAKYCIYFKKLEDLDIAVLEKLCRLALDYHRGK